MFETVLKEKLTQVKKLPSSPQIVSDLLKQVQNPVSGIRDFERVIARDPAIATQVMRVANSPFYALSRTITNLRLALSLLGIDEIMRIALNVSLYKSLRQSFSDLSFDFAIFWGHSRKTAKLAEMFAGEFCPRQKAEAYVIGLIHDIGKLVLDQYFSEEWTEVLMEFAQTGRDVTFIEQDIMGFNHAYVAAELMKIWNLPEDIIYPILYHHTPFDSPGDQKLTTMIYAADKTAAWLTSPELVHQSTQENLEKDEIWERTVQTFPDLDVLSAEGAREEFNIQLQNIMFYEK